MLLLVGLGLNPPGSLGVEAWEALQNADTVYLEGYTNLGISEKELATFLNRPVQLVGRDFVESDKLLNEASLKTVALCIIGDVFTATTHSVLYLECLKRDISLRVFQNAGIMAAVALSGLELYKFGQTVSIPYPQESFHPSSYLEKIAANRAAGLHTLCLLDIKADEKKFMTIPEAIPLLSSLQFSIMIGASKLGTENHIFSGTPDELRAHKWPSQPHSIILPGPLNAVEQEFIEYWSAQNKN